MNSPGQRFEYWSKEKEVAELAAEVAERNLAVIQSAGQMVLFLAYRSSHIIKEHEDEQ